MRAVFNKALVFLTITLLGAGVATRAVAAGDYLLATASTGGTYYPVGVALSTLVKLKLQSQAGINMSAINSAGSGENIKLLRDDESQFAILQGLYGAHAWNGAGPLHRDGPQRELRAVTTLWQNVEHFVVAAKHVESGTIADALAVEGVAGFGKKNSGSLGSSRTLFANLGVDIEQRFKLFYGGYGALAGALQNGKADLIGTPAGAPVGAVTKLLAAKGDGVRLLGFTAEQAAQADGGMALWSPFVISAGTYPGQDSDIPTIAQPNFLAVRADVSEQDVYQITKTIYENLGFLRSIHKATGAMTLDQATTGLPVPLHPGAARYYREAGLEIPDRLIVE